MPIDLLLPAVVEKMIKFITNIERILALVDLLDNLMPKHEPFQISTRLRSRLVASNITFNDREQKSCVFLFSLQN